MSVLSISAAARQHASRCALIVEDREYTYSELAELTASVELCRPNVYRGEGTLETALRLYASLDAEQPVCFLQTALEDTAAESQRLQLATSLDASVALVLFTSGSTGTAKGVMLSRKALIASACASEQRLGWSGNDRWLCCLPLSHIGGLSILLRCLIARKTVILQGRFDPQSTAELMQAQRATHISLVPTMLGRLVELGHQAPTRLRVALIGGAAIGDELATRARAAGYPLRLTYGMTETGSQVVTDGTPVDGAQLRVRQGRLEIAGPMLMDGYLPGGSGIVDGWFRSADRATIADDGQVFIEGRDDATIISGGENIDPREIEAALLQLPSVHEVYALGIPDPQWGQVLVALVVTKGPTPCLEELPLRGHRRPKMLIPVQALPQLENGKIDHQQAIQIAKARARYPS